MKEFFEFVDLFSCSNEILRVNFGPVFGGYMLHEDQHLVECLSFLNRFREI